MLKHTIMFAAIAGLVFALAPAAQAIVIETVPVGNPGNAADTRYETPGYGAVAYTYNIGKYEVTAGQYTAFLNAKAQSDPYGLYNTNMWTSDFGCKIERTGSSGSYGYSVASGPAIRPVNYVNWGDAARFANWLHNGQGGGDTETGAYDVNGAMTDAELMGVSRQAGWKWAIPTEDEWYKAAYYDAGGASYYDYPTGEDTAPTTVASGTDPYTAVYLNYSAPADVDQSGGLSPYGTMGEGGNLWEWNEALIGSSRGFRGGAFFCDDDSSLLASYRKYDFPSSEYNDVGFRVSEVVPEPATMAFLAFGSIGILMRRRRHRG